MPFKLEKVSELTTKTIVIIGGSGGLGQKVTHALCNKQDVGHYESQTFQDRYRIISLSSKQLDVRNFKACQEFFEGNQVDVVINLSGVNHDKFVHKLAQEDQYKINYLLDVNLHGTVNLVSAALPGMRERGHGKIILVSSVLSTKNVVGTALYSSCKAFIDRFVKSVSIENASKGITANSIQLGYFDGGLTEKLNNPETFKNEIPLKRWGTIEELCSTIEFMINNDYLTGTNIPLTGGL